MISTQDAGHAVVGLLRGLEEPRAGLTPGVVVMLLRAFPATAPASPEPCLWPGQWPPFPWGKVYAQVRSRAPGTLTRQPGVYSEVIRPQLWPRVQRRRER